MFSADVTSFLFLDDDGEQRVVGDRWTHNFPRWLSGDIHVLVVVGLMARSWVRYRNVWSIATH